jgi:putative ABC transport system substrate-binding protein
LGLKLVVVNASIDSGLEMAFATLSQQHVGAVLVGISALYTRRAEQLAALAARYALPAIFPYREHALAGGLMSYGSSLGDGFHQVGFYTGRILNGDRPADLPVQQLTKIKMVINLKTAKALGPPSRKRCWPPPTRPFNETARVHCGAWERGGVAARGARAAGGQGCGALVCS